MSSRSGSMVGQVVDGKYRLLRLLGGGGMGDVYEAENLAVGRRVAIKLLRQELTAQREIVLRFRQEARAAARIGHPNIIAVYDFDRDGETGPYYMVQELLHGTDLRRRLDERGRLPAVEALQIVLPLLDALATAHENGVLHRDIKPANVFLAREPSGAVVPKLIDFGVAKVLEQGQQSAAVTRAGMFIGTLNYMAPEQLRAQNDIDHRADIWAMGVMIYEMVAGRCPFVAPEGSLDLVSIARFADRVIHEPAPLLDSLVMDVPPDVSALVHRALQSDREARYQMMREFHAAVRGTPTLAPKAAFTNFVPDPSSILRADPGDVTIAPGLVPISGAVSAHAAPTVLPVAAVPPQPVLPVAAVPPQPGADRQRVSPPSPSPPRVSRVAWFAAGGLGVVLAVIGLLMAMRGGAPATADTSAKVIPAQSAPPDMTAPPRAPAQTGEASTTETAVTPPATAPAPITSPGIPAPPSATSAGNPIRPRPSNRTPVTVPSKSATRPTGTVAPPRPAPARAAHPEDEGLNEEAPIIR